ncbi:beta-ketoacyl-ACP synthase 3 [Longimicrobium sp.]|uniref:3-oxoacyl-ACP synthase III family protein n=1 Tax=Longimicrobium sp. TaxID=2029185 RepID=UPI002E377C95|nr:beta-ketoacyl-ACP synthase 3 [Longimicrobium sp.]HEX6037346.1 beta-ketoacyl-ACP synthase 3 [Longimicrobium sp.]
MADPAGPVHLAGTGAWLPPRVLGNAEVAALAGVTEEWIVRRTGIQARRVAGDDEGAAVMSAHAARAALGASGIPAESLAAIIVATTTPDHLTPPTACELQAALGAWGAACFDVEAGFAGWIYALVLADSLLRAGRGDAALVVGVEKLSTVTDRADPSTGPLFGDGAGAAVLARGSGPRTVRSTSWWADGRLADALKRPAGGALRPFDARVLEERSHLLRMEGTKLFKAAVRTMAQQAQAALSAAGLAKEDVGLVVPHQANLRIIEGLVKEMELDASRVYVNIDRFGNTGAATIPIALDEAVRAGRADDGAPLLLVSFGAGATAGAAVLG